MRECNVCLTTKPVELFTTKSPACNTCMHIWWKEHGPGKRRSNHGGKRKK